jgi:hypothetical protein
MTTRKLRDTWSRNRRFQNTWFQTTWSLNPWAGIVFRAVEATHGLRKLLRQRASDPMDWQQSTAKPSKTARKNALFAPNQPCPGRECLPKANPERNAEYNGGRERVQPIPSGVEVATGPAGPRAGVAGRPVGPVFAGGDAWVETPDGLTRKPRQGVEGSGPVDRAGELSACGNCSLWSLPAAVTRDDFLPPVAFGRSHRVANSPEKSVTRKKAVRRSS